MVFARLGTDQDVLEVAALQPVERDDVEQERLKQRVAEALE